MVPGEIINYSDFERIVTQAHAGQDKPRLMGVLFMKDSQDQAKKEIIPSLNYFDSRTKDDIHFVIPGWEVDALNGREDWRFSERGFAHAVEVFEQETSWRYIGEVQLILCAARMMSHEKTPNIGHDVTETALSADMSRVIDMDFSSLKDNAIFKSVSSFFEVVRNFAKKFEGDDPIGDFSKQELRVAISKGVTKILVSGVTKGGKDFLDYTSQTKVKNISKEHVPMIRILSSTKEGKKLK